MGITETGQNVPICVDLDGTILRSNSLLECAFVLLRESPGMIFALPFWFLRGQAYLWTRVVEGMRRRLDPGHLPYRPETVAWIRKQKAEGQSIFLVTGAHRVVAEAVAEHLGVFDGIIATCSPEVHCVGNAKRDLLVAQFREGQFDYVGDSDADLPVWRSCRRAVVVPGNPRISRALSREGRDCESIGVESESRSRALFRAQRPHQWAKNLLVFAAVVLSHNLFNLTAVVGAACAMLCFCALSSATYIVNDAIDLDVDRQHASKRRRPFASGTLSLVWAGVLPPLLLVPGVAVGFLMAPRFGEWLLVYVVLSMLYSLRWKRYPILDVISLAALYAIRVVAGGAATGILISPWTLAFIMFLFFSLALAKRYSELYNLHLQDQRKPGRRGYLTTDMPCVQSLGTSSGLVATLVLVLYIQSPENARLYHHPTVMWLMCPVLGYWIAKIWLLASRGEMNEDPVLHALRDRTSYILGAVAAAIMVTAAWH